METENFRRDEKRLQINIKLRILNWGETSAILLPFARNDVSSLWVWAEMRLLGTAATDWPTDHGDIDKIYLDRTRSKAINISP